MVLLFYGLFPFAVGPYQCNQSAKAKPLKALAFGHHGVTISFANSRNSRKPTAQRVGCGHQNTRGKAGETIVCVFAVAVRREGPAIPMYCIGKRAG